MQISGTVREIKALSNLIEVFYPTCCRSVTRGSESEVFCSRQMKVNWCRQQPVMMARQIGAYRLASSGTLWYYMQLWKQRRRTTVNDYENCPEWFRPITSTKWKGHFTELHSVSVAYTIQFCWRQRFCSHCLHWNICCRCKLS